MDTFNLLFAAALAGVAVAALLQLAWGALNIPVLRDVPPSWRPSARVSMIVAARDEARHVERAIRSLLEQSYPLLDLIVVDDRSSDATPGILARLATANAALRIERVTHLPAGWLGKNHALHLGASSAGGDLLLFLDADVVLEPDTVSRAVRLLEVERAGHLAVAPDIVAPTWPLALVVNYFMMWFLLWLRPWRSRDPRSAAYIGIGAFNLVRADAYRLVGGHERIALRPDDDLMLGKLLKRAGVRQVLASGDGLVSVEWYRNLGELARGLRKNAFAGLGYSVALSLGAIAGNVLLCVWPFIAVGLSHGAARVLYATAAVAQLIAYAGPAASRRSRPWLAFLYPVAAALFVVILASAVLRTLRRGGIEWRGTFYPLAALRRNRI